MKWRQRAAGKPLDRALFAAFAETVHATGLSRVADLGCGPGRITTHLHSLGLDTFGLDLSPAMISVARRRYPHLEFAVGSINELDIADDALGGIVSWYSIIHTPREHLPTVFAEFHRVLCGGGYLLLAFQVGDECVHLDQAYGHAVSLDVYRRQPEKGAALLTDTASTSTQPDATRGGTTLTTHEAWANRRRVRERVRPAIGGRPSGPDDPIES